MKRKTYEELKEIQRELMRPLPKRVEVKKPKKSDLKLIGLLLLIPTSIGILFPISLILIGIIFVMIIVDFFKQR